MELVIFNTPAVTALLAAALGLSLWDARVRRGGFLLVLTAAAGAGALCAAFLAGASLRELVIVALLLALSLLHGLDREDKP